MKFFRIIMLSIFSMVIPFPKIAFSGIDSSYTMKIFLGSKLNYIYNFNVTKADDRPHLVIVGVNISKYSYYITSSLYLKPKMFEAGYIKPLVNPGINRLGINLEFGKASYKNKFYDLGICLSYSKDLGKTKEFGSIFLAKQHNFKASIVNRIHIPITNNVSFSPSLEIGYSKQTLVTSSLQEKLTGVLFGLSGTMSFKIKK